eukprot:1515858-Amphidinium_carterae.1
MELGLTMCLGTTTLTRLVRHPLRMMDALIRNVPPAMELQTRSGGSASPKVPRNINHDGSKQRKHTFRSQTVLWGWLGDWASCYSVPSIVHTQLLSSCNASQCYHLQSLVALSLAALMALGE